MKNKLPLLMFLLTVAIGCKKRDIQPQQEQAQSVIFSTPVPSAPTGSLSGTVNPQESITKVIIISVQTGSRYSTKIEGGIFSLKGLPEGKYTLEFTPNDFYLKPENTTIDVNMDKNTEVSTISPKERASSISCYVNEQYQSWYRKAYYSGTFLQLAKLTIGSGIPEDNMSMDIDYELSISISKFIGTGTYICDSSTSSSLSYKVIRGSLPISIQTTEKEGNSATIIITSVDATARTITGTFTAKLGDRTFTKGTINANY